MTVATYDLETAAKDSLDLAGSLSRVVAYRKSGNDLDERLDLESVVGALRVISSALGFELVAIDPPISALVAS